MVHIHTILKINNSQISTLDKSLTQEFILNTMIDSTWSVIEVAIVMAVLTKEEDSSSTSNLYKNVRKIILIIANCL